MSLATKQSVSFLAIINSLMTTIETSDIANDLLPTVLFIGSESKKAAMNWEETGNWESNTKWMLKRMAEPQQKIKEEKDIYTFIVLSLMAQILIEDLYEMIQNKKKLSILLPIKDAINNMVDNLDINGNKYKSAEKAWLLIKEVYLSFEFDIDKITLIQKKKKRRNE